MNRPIAAAFAGRIGTGKSSLSIALAADMHWKRASFGDFVRSIAEERGVVNSRHNLQEIGAELESSDAFAFCRDVLNFAGWISGEPVVIDGIRHVRVLEIVRELIAPIPLLFVYLDGEEQSRKARLLRRDGVDGASFVDAESHSTERDVASRLPELADLRLFSKDGSERELLVRIKDRLRAIAQ